MAKKPNTKKQKEPQVADNLEPEMEAANEVAEKEIAKDDVAEGDADSDAETTNEVANSEVLDENILKNFKCPDGAIFDREDLAIDWCRMRKMEIGKIEKI